MTTFRGQRYEHRSSATVELRTKRSFTTVLVTLNASESEPVGFLHRVRNGYEISAPTVRHATGNPHATAEWVPTVEDGVARILQLSGL